ncbi:MAG: oligosaccharide flippase family protein [Solirubrobacteraceae bacterium]|jgi:O-antigen/teichoic acid export membrane protein
MGSSTERAPASPGDPLAAGPAGAQFLRGGATRVFAYVGGIATSIVALPFVTRHLHSSDYGRYVVVTSLILIVALLSEGGIGNLGVREFSGAPGPERREFMRNLIGIRISLSALGGAGAILFALLAGYPRVEVEGTAIAAFGLVLAGVQVTLTVPLTAALRLQWLAALDFLVPAVTALGLVVLVVLGAPLLAFFAAAVVAYATSLVLTAALVRREVTLRPAFHPARWRELLRDSVVFAAATALGVVYFQVVVVAMSLISTPQQTGVFSLAFRVLSVVGGIPVLLGGSAFPILLRAARDDRERLRYACTRLLEGSLLLGGWLSLLVVAGAPFAIHVIGGPGFAGSATVLRILGAGVIATFVAAVFAMTLLSLRAYRLLIATSIGMVVLAVVLCALLIPTHGARGAAVVTLTLEVVLACTYATILAVRDPQLRPELGRCARICAALAIGFAAAIAVPVSSVPAALIGTAALALAAVALRAVPVELFALLRPRGT